MIKNKYIHPRPQKDIKHPHPQKDVVTVNTDASYDPATGSGGFGLWIVSDFFRIRRHGEFRDKITDPNEAEIKALINALDILNRREEKFKVLVINCDNQTVRQIIKTKKVPDRFKVEGTILLNELSYFNIVRAKTIRGHKRANTSRQFVNCWCDKASKKYRKA